jgi:hypothetical protein
VTILKDTDPDSKIPVPRNASADRFLVAAAHSLILARCRHIFTHELRAALNPMLLAVELLSRAANSAAKNPSVLEQSSTLAKRAVGMLDKSTVELFNQIMNVNDTPAVVNLSTMLEEIVRLLRPDLDLKAIALHFSATPEVTVRAAARQLRLFLLGIIAVTIDQLPEASQLSLALLRSGSDAVIDVHANIDLPRIETPDLQAGNGAGSAAPYGLVLSAARQWVMGNGGGLEFLQSETARMRLHFPLEPNQPTPGAGDQSHSNRVESARV